MIRSGQGENSVGNFELVFWCRESILSQKIVASVAIRTEVSKPGLAWKMTIETVCECVHMCD